jgi:cytochrome P450
VNKHLPVYEPDVFAPAAIDDPWSHYRRMRDLGPVVWLAAPGIPAVTRYDGVRAVLADHETFRSGQGVLFTQVANQMTRGTTLASDPPLHDTLRRVVAHRLTPRALRDQRDMVQAKADEVVAHALRIQAGRGAVDGVADIAQAMPLAVVPDFLGFPEDARGRLLDWASGAIEAGGPGSERTPRAVELASELGAYTHDLVEREGLLPGSLGADVLAAADRGEIEHEQCAALLLDYFGPSLETTISALGSALALFSQHPAQWQLLREDPSLVAGAFNEVVRLESPLRAFTRLTSRDTVIDGTPVPAGTRVAVFFASANRDERRWDRPDEFDIRRDNNGHLGLGYGVHGCAGQGLARLEFSAVMTRLAGSVTRLEPAGQPTRVISSLLRAWSSLPLRLHAATPAATGTAS